VAGTPLSPIKVPYNDLQWGVFGARANGVSILRSRSGENTAANSMLNDAVKGGVRPFITTDYQGSSARYFQLSQAYIGCAVTTEASIGVPQACTLKFTGTQYPSGKVVTKTCGYAGSALSPALAPCQFGSDFASVRRVDIEVVNSATTTTTTVLYLDDVNVKVFKTA